MQLCTWMPWESFRLRYSTIVDPIHPQGDLSRLRSSQTTTRRATHLLLRLQVLSPPSCSAWAHHSRLLPPTYCKRKLFSLPFALNNSHKRSSGYRNGKRGNAQPIVASTTPLKAGKRTKQGARRLKKQRVQHQAAQPQPQKRPKSKTMAELDAEMDAYRANGVPIKVSESMT